ncbi:MAG TPA: hypothetical protein VF342_13095 [Alphaproteobacteria bacterium]
MEGERKANKTPAKHQHRQAFSRIQWGNDAGTLEAILAVSTAAIDILLLATMSGMFLKKKVNAALYVVFAVLTAGSFWARRPRPPKFGGLFVILEANFEPYWRALHIGQHAAHS